MRSPRIALVGAGYIAEYHVAVLRELGIGSIEALVDPDATRARSFAERHSIPHVFASIDDLRGKVDVAHLLVPPDLHASLTQRLLELDVGVFAEKPVTLRAPEARALAASAAPKRLALGGNHNNLFHPAFARLRERVAAGEIGRVEHVQVTLSVPLAQLDAGDYSHWMFRTPRNIVYEQAVHPLCQVHALIGRVRSLDARVLSTRELNPGQQFHDRWSISGVGERGTLQLYLAFGQGFTRSTLQVIGSDGSLEADLAHNALAGETKSQWLEFWNSYRATAGRGAQQKRDARRVLLDYLKFTLGLSVRQDAFYVGMRSSIEHFYAALEQGVAPPVDFENAAQVLEWCDAIADAVPVHATPPVTLPAPPPAREREVCVIGATGFIGQRTIAKLLERGLPVTVIARRAHSLPTIVQENVENGRIRFLRGSLELDTSEQRDRFAQLLRGAHTVIQLATGNGDTWEKVERSMVRGSRAVAEAALAADVKRFVYVSSIAALDTSERGASTPIADSTQCDPRLDARPLYTRGKAAAEATLLDLQRERGLPLVIVRPGVVMGAGTPMQHSGLGLWTRDNHCVGWGDGLNPLPIVWVDDVADALAALAQYEGTDLHGRALNLCARSVLCAREIVDELRAVTQRAVSFHPRGLATSQTMEIGKWLVKKAGRRKGVEFPSWHDLKARALVPQFQSDLARTKLGWKPVEDREGLLDRCVRVYRVRLHSAVLPASLD